MLPAPPKSTLFPYPTLFRSGGGPSWPSLPSARLSCGPSTAAALPERAGERRRARTISDCPPTCRRPRDVPRRALRSEEHTSELQSLAYLVCRLLLEKKNRHQ